MIEQAKLTYFPIGKAFEKQIKTNKDQGIKQVEALKALKLEKKVKNQNQLKDFFQKKQEQLMNIKMKNMKLKNVKKKLNEKF